MADLPRTVYEGRIFTVCVEPVVLPNGARLEAEIVRHPGSVVIVPVTDTGDLVLVRQYRYPIGQHVWELPAGSLKPGEDVARAAARECQEETGLIPGHLDRLGAFFPTPGYCDELMHVYRATALRTPGDDDPAAHPDEDEDIDVQTFTRREVDAMIASGELVDLKTLASLTLLDRC